MHVTIELLDARDGVLASSVYTIKRGISYDGAWHETSDTRIAPGETRPIARAWRAAGPSNASAPGAGASVAERMPSSCQFCTSG